MVQSTIAGISVIDISDIGNVFRGVAGIAKASTGEIAAKIVELDNKVGNVAGELSRTDKIMSGAIKGGNFLMRNINPAIGTTELVKVLFAEDKLDAALTGGCAFGGMLLGEGAAKRILGLSKTSYEKGVYKAIPREALYKKLACYPQVREQLKAIKDYLVTKHIVSEKILKHVPPVAKGITFAAISILTYGTGRLFGKFLSKCAKGEDKNAKQVKIQGYSQAA